MQLDVLIVGAGAAGLMAARELSKAGKSVVILEARDRIGGRICPLSTKEWGYEAQGGAEFVHGTAPITRALIEEAGLTLNYPVEWWNVLDGPPKKRQRESPHDEFLKQKLLELKEDMSVMQFLDTYFPADTYADLRQYIIRRTESYEAADPRRASVFTLRDDVTNEQEWTQHNIKEGYGALLCFIESQCKQKGVEILLNKEVTSIDFSKENVNVLCKDGSTYSACRVVVTTPVPILETLKFIPTIPQKIKAASNLGFGGVTKILLRFKTKWWASPEREANFERMFFMFSNEEIPTWWTQYPEPHLVLTGWLGGPKAQKLSTCSDEELTEKSLQSLSNIFKIKKDELQKELLLAKVMNWPKDPFARGAYSYATPESEAAIAELSKPIDNKVFFAGEAIAEENASIVEGAFASGLKAAQQIIG